MANIKRANTSGITKSGAAISDVPDAPTIGAVTDANTGTSVTVAFTAATTGGAVTTFTATSTPGTITGTSATSPITVSGLTDGTAYTFKVKGTNSTATGPESAASASVTPTFSPLGAYDSIATTTVGSGGAASISFTSIPSTYTHLQIRGLGRNNSASTQFDDIKIQFNSDTASNYRFHQVYGTGASAAAYASPSTTYNAALLAQGGNTAGIFAVNTIDLLDYANTNKYKTTRILNGYDKNGSGFISLTSGLWMSTSAVTRIDLTPLTGSFVEYSSFALYGIKGA